MLIWSRDVSHSFSGEGVGWKGTFFRKLFSRIFGSRNLQTSKILREIGLVPKHKK